jgi:hypothetical protein
VYGHQKKGKGMKENGKSKRERDLAHGLMDKVNHIQEIGSRVSIMEKVFIK